MRLPAVPAEVGGRLFAGILLTASLSVLDSTLVVPLLSTIGEEFDAGSQIAWLVAAYLIASTVTIPVWGRALDLLGERKVMWTALLIFGLGSIVGALAPSLLVLVLARALQGIGAGGLVPVSQAIISARCKPQERARLQIYYNSAYGAAAGLGPLIGGALVSVSWRWSFALLLPLIVLAGLLLAGKLRSEPSGAPGRPFDVRGSALLTFALLVTLVGVERSVPWVVVCGVALIAGFVTWSLRIDHAVVPQSLLRNRTAVLISLFVLPIGFGQFAILTYLPGLSQDLDPTLNSGLVVLPFTILGMTMGAFTGTWALRVGTRRLAVLSAVLLSVAMLVVALSGALPGLFVAAGLMGLAAGFAITPALLLIQHSADVADVGSATSLMVLTRNFGGSLGAAVMAVLLADVGSTSAFLLAATLGVIALIPALLLPGPLAERAIIARREAA